jgi:hypothetical protein
VDAEERRDRKVYRPVTIEAICHDRSRHLGPSKDRVVDRRGDQAETQNLAILGLKSLRIIALPGDRHCQFSGDCIIKSVVCRRAGISDGGADGR